MTEIKYPKDRFPYGATWLALTPKQQLEVRRRAKRLQISLPEMLYIMRKEARTPKITNN